MTIGILPCAGAAERFNGLPKALLPCPEGFLLQRHVINMKKAGCEGVGVCTNEEMYPILEPYCQYQGLFSNYYDRLLTVRGYETMTETVISFYNYCKGMGHSILDHSILFGMPDTYFAEDWDIYKRMAEYIERPNTDVMVAMFTARPGQHKKMGMVKSVDGLLVDVVDKPEETKYTEGWGALAWKPSFWQYLKPEMPHVGFGLMEAVRGGLKVRTCYTNGSYYDCGDRESYFEMIRGVTCEPE